MKVLVLDGYNVIHAVPHLRRQLDQSLEAARNGLLADCRAYQARHQQAQRLYVVFDGQQDEVQAPAANVGGMSVIFTKKSEEADERILGLIRADYGKNTFVIVSNDTYVFNNSRAHGARVLSVAEFYAQMKPGNRPASATSSAGDKATLSSQDARHITEEYRKHLERGDSGESART